MDTDPDPAAARARARSLKSLHLPGTRIPRAALSLSIVLTSVPSAQRLIMMSSWPSSTMISWCRIMAIHEGRTANIYHRLAHTTENDMARDNDSAHLAGNITVETN
jgi:hypothetical protein